MNDFISIVCYIIGDWISRSPLCYLKIGGSAYQNFMKWSVYFDKREKIWKKPSE